MANALYIGFHKEITLPRSGLFISDEVPDIPKARIFDPTKHSFNPLDGLTYKKARELAEVLYLINPQGENTLTVRNGKRELLKALLEAKQLDQVKWDDEVDGLISDLLSSPILKRVFCGRTNFSFNPRSLILARIDRTELGEFDALVLGLFLMAHFKGQLIVEDLGFYGREPHASLIREGRLIAGVNFLGELPTKLRRAVLLIPEKVASGTLPEDAEVLAAHEALIKGTIRHGDFVSDAMS